MVKRTPPPAALRAVLGQRVRARRLELGLSQDALARLAELHRNYIGGIEQGRRNPGLVNLVRIAVALGLDPGELLARIDKAKR